MFVAISIIISLSLLKCLKVILELCFSNRNLYHDRKNPTMSLRFLPPCFNGFVSFLPVSVGGTNNFPITRKLWQRDFADVIYVPNQLTLG